MKHIFLEYNDAERVKLNNCKTKINKCTEHDNKLTMDMANKKKRRTVSKIFDNERGLLIPTVTQYLTTQQTTLTATKTTRYIIATVDETNRERYPAMTKITLFTAASQVGCRPTWRHCPCWHGQSDDTSVNSIRNNA